MELLQPLLENTAVKPIAKVVMGTVQGDVHDIGKNLAIMMLKGAGFEVVDLGVNVAPARFVEAAADEATVVGMSALLTTTMPNMKATIDAIQQAGLRDKVKVIIGGAPVTQDYANQIGADGFSADASRAVSLAQTLI
jgi:methylmalonyl-CoA mutase cobalamin-binding domain/chain